MSQRISAVRACLHGVGAPQLLEVTRFGEVTGLPVLIMLHFQVRVEED